MPQKMHGNVYREANMHLGLGIRSYIRRQFSLRRVRRLVMDRETILVEVGAGDRKGVNGWLTLDINRNCDIDWDVRHGLPFLPGSVAKIYSSHFLEHLTFMEAQSFLDECKRVLQPGGTFSVCVPNARIYIEAYLNSRDLDPKQHFFQVPWAFNNTTRIDYVNFTAYMNGQHKYMFDIENLLFILNSRGFKNVRPRDFDPTLDRIERDYESIYAEGQK